MRGMNRSWKKLLYWNNRREACHFIQQFDTWPKVSNKLTHLSWPHHKRFKIEVTDHNEINLVIKHTFTGSTMIPSLCIKNRKKYYYLAWEFLDLEITLLNVNVFIIPHSKTNYINIVTALSTLPSLAQRSQKPWTQTKRSIWYLTKLLTKTWEHAAQKCIYGKFMLPAKNKMGVGLHLKLPMLHRNKWMLVCSMPSADLQFG
jgi:hypothetical protein